MPIKHNIGDLVCWSQYCDKIGYIADITYATSEDNKQYRIYIVEWSLIKDDLDKYSRTSHTESGITNLKKYLQYRLENGLLPKDKK